MGQLVVGEGPTGLLCKDKLHKMIDRTSEEADRTSKKADNASEEAGRGEGKRKGGGG